MIIVHYAEIGLKVGNRKIFEKLLAKNIARKIQIPVENEYGKLIIRAELTEELENILKCIPGIAYFSPVVAAQLKEDAISQKVLEHLKETYPSKDPLRFRVTTKRQNKKFALSSQQLNQSIGSLIATQLGWTVDLKKNDVDVKIEISNQFAFISTKNIQGVGGLPTNQKQKIVCLLSGGFDSPVASYLMMKRGIEVIFVHCKNQNQMSDSVEKKITMLAEQLQNYQLKTLLYIVPFEDLQKEIIMNIPAKDRMVLYRKCMISIAKNIAKQHKAKFIILGDSISQVASQTLSNLDAIYEEGILTPLIGMNKQEIIDTAIEIGTYEISKLPYGDCCSYFVPKNPALNLDKKTVASHLEQIDLKLIDEAISSSETQVWNA